MKPSALGDARADGVDATRAEANSSAMNSEVGFVRCGARDVRSRGALGRRNVDVDDGRDGARRR
jgi:hypothetical protein